MKLFKLPIPPSINKLYPTNKYGRRFKSQEYLDWEDCLQDWCLFNKKDVIKIRQIFFVEQKVPHLIDIRVEFYFKWSTALTKKGEVKKHDGHNRLKPLYDGISTIIGVDDRYFWDTSSTTYILPQDSTLDPYFNVELKWKIASWVS